MIAETNTAVMDWDSMNKLGTILVVSLLYTSLAVTPGPASDNTLKIFGNANMDDVIDEEDIEYVLGIIDETNEATELADANYDGRIDEGDVIQIELIIAGEENELTIVDMVGRTVTVPVPVEGVVVSHREQFEQLRAIGVPKDVVLTAERQILTTEEYTIYFAEYQDLPDVGSCSNPNLEAIIGLRPDLILMGSYGENSSQHSAALDVFESAGIPLIYAHETETNFAENIRMLGYAFGKTNKAEEYIDWREDLIDSIEERLEDVPEKDKRKVYVEWWGRYTTKDETATRVGAMGGECIFEGEANGAVNPEEVVKQNPDVVIIIGSKGSGYITDDITELKELRDEFMNREELQDVTAVKTGDVYVMSVYITGTGPYHGGRDFMQEAYLAKWLNPTYFDDFEPKSVHQDYLTQFQGLDWNLDVHGAYVYHPVEHPDGN